MPRGVLVVMDKQSADDPADPAADPDPEQLGELPAGQAQQNDMLKRNLWPRAILVAALSLITIGLVIWHVLGLSA
jgi:hypothetical protein